MNLSKFSSLLQVLLLGMFLAACGGSGGSGGSGGDTGGVDSPEPTDCDGSSSITVSGRISFEDVPVAQDPVDGVYLDYDNTATKPVPLAKMLVECADGSTVFAESTTAANGEYSVTIPQGVDARLVVRAESVRSDGPTWDIKVVDNTNGQAVWAIEGERFATDDSDLVVNLVAGSGWDGDRVYDGVRAGGVFSIYETVYQAMQLVASADPNVTFNPLLLNWSPGNRTTCNSPFPYEDGCTGTSFYTSGQIFILGDEGGDTDEYDDSVVAHEWGHYYEDTFSRSDSVGGPHSGGDALDIRVAFGEGWGNALSGMILDETYYRDTFGPQQSNGFALGLETQPTSDEGWWNETNVQLILFDLFDDAIDDNDTISLGFGPIHTVLTGPQKTTEAFTSIFSFIHYIVDGGHAGSTQVDPLLADNEISPIVDPWGGGRGAVANDETPATDNSQDDYVSPVYLDLTDAVNNGTVTDICVTDFYGDYNKLGTRRYASFTVITSGDYRFELDGSAGITGSDPDFYIYEAGEVILEAADYSASSDPAENPDFNDVGEGVEVGTVNLQTGTTYTADLHEWLHHDGDDTTTGATCLQLTVNEL
jgi:hypothetical protein